MKLFKLIAAAAAMSISALALVAVPAQATASIVMFSNENVTDPTEEDADMADALESLGTVTLFDGGDGSASAWTTALSGATALVLPEGDVFNSDYMTDAAADVLAGFVAAGHPIITTGAYEHADLIDYITEIDRDWEDDSVDGQWDLNIASDVLPESLPNANYAGGISNWADWTLDDRAGVTPIYIDSARTNVGVAAFAHGSGFIYYYGYDWYPDGEEITSGVRESWNEALRLGASGEFSAALEASPVAIGISLDIAVGDAIEGAPVTAEASGLKADTDWTLTLRSTPIVLDEGVVGNAGAILASVTIPAGLEPGTHTLTVVGTAADGTVYQRVLTFVIASDGTLESEPVLGALEVVELPNTGAGDFAPLGLSALALMFAGAAAVAVRRRKA
ncbi:MAG: LPXTG cell wall anchor domain-containing protein [Microbacteriaceae bacterium]